MAKKEWQGVGRIRGLKRVRADARYGVICASSPHASELFESRIIWLEKHFGTVGLFSIC